MKNQTTLEQPATFTATFRLWTRNGHTPLTKRGGAFCDLLTMTTAEVTGPAEARAKLAELAKDFPDAEAGHFTIPTFPNQNVREDWRHGSSLRNA